MIDFTNMYCKVHPYELITNFCSKQKCQIGLCATCICNHTEQHLKSYTFPQYQNIRATFTQTHTKVRSLIQQLQQGKIQISDLKLEIEDNKRVIKQYIQQNRIKCLALVNEYFDKFAKESEQSLSFNSTKYSLHSQYRMQSLSTTLSKEITSLINISQQLNSSHFLDVIKRVKEQYFTNSQNIKRKVSKQIQQNRKYSYEIEVSKDTLTDIKKILNKLIKLQFKYPDALLTKQSFLKIQSKDKENNHNYLSSKLQTEKSIYGDNQPLIYNLKTEEKLSYDDSQSYFHIKNKSAIFSNEQNINKFNLTQNINAPPKIECQSKNNQNRHNFTTMAPLIKQNKNISNYINHSPGKHANSSMSYIKQGNQLCYRNNYLGHTTNNFHRPIAQSVVFKSPMNRLNLQHTCTDQFQSSISNNKLLKKSGIYGTQNINTNNQNNNNENLRVFK